MFVVQEFGMIEVRALHMGSGPLGDGTQFFDGCFSTAALKTMVAFAQRFGDGAG
jgi:hypothetical protein